MRAQITVFLYLGHILYNTVIKLYKNSVNQTEERTTFKTF